MEDEARDLINSVSKGNLVKPINYEEWIEEKSPILKDCDPHPNLMLFPEDDIEVTNQEKEFRVKRSDVVPESALEYSEDNPHVFDTATMITQDWNIVNRKYENPSPVSSTLEDKSRNLLQHKYAIDLDPKSSLSEEELKALEENENNRQSFASLSEESFEVTDGDQMIVGYLKDYTLPKIKITDHANKAIRSKHRPTSLFSLYTNPQTFNLDKGIESRKRPPVPPSHEKPHKILITCRKLEMTPVIEPFYASLAMYDAKLKKKVSETFHFDLNSNDMLKKAGSKLKFDNETRGSSAIFNITEPTSDMFLLIRLEKTLQKNELSDSFEAYQNNTDNPKIVQKNAQIAQDYCSRLGKYRMPFVWVGFNLERSLTGHDGQFIDPNTYNYDKDNGVGSLKSESDNFDSLSLGSTRFPSIDKKNSRMGSLSNHSSFEQLDPASKIRVNLSNFAPKQGMITRAFKQETEHLSDEDICKYMFDTNNKKNSTLKKLKFLPIHVRLEIEMASYQDKAILTPAVKKVQPFKSTTREGEIDRWLFPIREVEEFPGKEVYIPYHDYKNFLYIYPLSLNFSNRTGSSGRNIMLKVQLLECEGEAGVLSCIYGKSSQKTLKSEAVTCVQYHNKTPTFYEEIKIELPPYLSRNHHLLFSFYHIVCQNPKQAEKQKEKEQLIGVTWLPLRMRFDKQESKYQDDVLALALGEHRLPVCTEIPKKEYSVISPKQFRPDQQVKLPSLQWVDDYKDLFHVRVSAVSSIHQQDEKLNHFTHCYYKYTQPLKPKNDSAAIELALKRSIEALSKAADEPVVRHVYLTLDRLFTILVKPSLSTKGGSLSSIAFKAITEIVKKVHLLHDNNKTHKLSRNSILASYVAYIFKIPPLDQEQKTCPRTSSMSRIGDSEEDSEDTPRNSPTKLSPLESRAKSFTATHVPDQEGAGRLRSSSVVTRASKRIHEQIVAQWLITEVREQTYENAWFFFEVVIKSMAQHLKKTVNKSKSRKSWFPKDFKEDMELLIKLIASKIRDTAGNKPLFSQFLNKSLAYFLQDLFSLMDRGFVFNLVRLYWSEVEEQTETTEQWEVLAELKLSLLQVLCLHEHYVQLNLPYPHSLFNEKNSIKSHQFKAKLKSTKTAQSLRSLNKTYCERHYLIGLLLSMEGHLLNFSQNQKLQGAVIRLTRDILYRHDNECNLQDTGKRSRVASLYLPFITIVMDVYDKLWMQFGSQPSGDDDKRADESGEQNMNSPQSTLTRSNNKGQILKFSTRTLLLCVLSILKNCDDELLKKWWSTMKPSRITTLISIIKLCVSCFEYDPNRKSSNKIAEKSEQAKVELEAMFIKGRTRHYKQASVDGSGTGSRWTRGLRSNQNKTIEVDTGDEEAVEDSLICAETSIITLDTIELLVESGSLSDGDNVNLSSPLVSKILDVILLMMSSNQSIHVMKMVFATQRSIITKFPHIIFEEETDQCSLLCYHLLRHCATFVAEVREEAIASIYLLMRQNYESVGSFSRVKIQLTIALSRLRSDSTDTSKACSDTYLKKSLITLENYAATDADVFKTRFPDQVKEVSKNLRDIMRDTVRMNEVKKDKDSAMRIDLMYRIAKGYQNSPALRITWLKSMANEHEKNGAKCEAAMCYIHAAALISEYMYMVEYQPQMPQGCIAYAKISPNVLQECAIIDDVLKPDEDGMCTGGEFSEKGLITLLTRSAKLLMDANMYESVDEVYNLLMAIHQDNRNYEDMCEMHKNLTNAYEKIHSMGKKRVMGSYFRVAFYGEKFNELDGVTMIYKEKPFTKLPEIAQRLQALYQEQFGDDFEFIADSKRIDRDLIDPYRAYVQVTFVEPYFDPFEKKYRKVDFEETFNVNRFYYSTPFTHAGSAHGAVGDQFKRLTVLTTECSFPYVKNRLEVVHIQETVMSPIEVATEDMLRKNQEFDGVLRSGKGHDGKVDVKMLQMLIQGAIGTTVNQGPLEIIETFLGSNARKPDVINDRYLKCRSRLRYQCKQFLTNCKEALEENKSVIALNQADYQREMEENLRRFTLAVAPHIFNCQAREKLGKVFDKTFDPDNSLTRTMSMDNYQP